MNTTQTKLTIDELKAKVKAAQRRRDDRIYDADRDLQREIEYLYALGVGAGLIQPGELAPWLKFDAV